MNSSSCSSSSKKWKRCWHHCASSSSRVRGIKRRHTLVLLCGPRLQRPALAPKQAWSV
jgi:hypothetical protein